MIPHHHILLTFNLTSTRHFLIPLRSCKNYVIPRFRLSLTNVSFFPSTLRTQNYIDLRKTIFQQLKRALISKMDVNKWYFFGQRKFNIIHAILRNSNNNLNYD